MKRKLMMLLIITIVFGGCSASSINDQTEENTFASTPEDKDSNEKSIDKKSNITTTSNTENITMVSIQENENSQNDSLSEVKNANEISDNTAETRTENAIIKFDANSNRLTEYLSQQIEKNVNAISFKEEYSSDDNDWSYDLFTESYISNENQEIEFYDPYNDDYNSNNIEQMYVQSVFFTGGIYKTSEGIEIGQTVDMLTTIMTPFNRDIKTLYREHLNDGKISPLIDVLNYTKIIRYYNENDRFSGFQDFYILDNTIVGIRVVKQTGLPPSAAYFDSNYKKIDNVNYARSGYDDYKELDKTMSLIQFTYDTFVEDLKVYSGDELMIGSDGRVLIKSPKYGNHHNLRVGDSLEKADILYNIIKSEELTINSNNDYYSKYYNQDMLGLDFDSIYVINMINEGPMQIVLLVENDIIVGIDLPSSP